MDTGFELIEARRRTRPFFRGLVATSAVRDHHRVSAKQFAQSKGWTDADDVIETRAAVVPTTTTTTNLAHTAVLDIVSMLGAASASGAAFIQAGVQASFEGITQISVATAITDDDGFGFIAQGSPFPVRQLSIIDSDLTVKKAGAAWVMTRQLLEGSNGEAFMRAATAENLSAGLDSILFDAVAADTIRPAGLRSYHATETPTVIGTNVTRSDAMDKDLANLAGNVAAVAGSLSNIIFFADAKTAVKINLRENFKFEVFATAGLPAGTVLALATNAFAVACDPTPRFSVSTQATVHMEDTSPLPLVAGSTVAAPTRSLFQTDTVGIRITFDCDFAMRSASGVSWVTGINW